jgi:hypothetical protein
MSQPIFYTNFYDSDDVLRHFYKIVDDTISDYKYKWSFLNCDKKIIDQFNIAHDDIRISFLKQIESMINNTSLNHRQRRDVFDSMVADVLIGTIDTFNRIVDHNNPKKKLKNLLIDIDSIIIVNSKHFKHKKISDFYITTTTLYKEGVIHIDGILFNETTNTKNICMVADYIYSYYKKIKHDTYTECTNKMGIRFSETFLEHINNTTNIILSKLIDHIKNSNVDYDDYAKLAIDNLNYVIQNLIDTAREYDICEDKTEITSVTITIPTDDLSDF